VKFARLIFHQSQIFSKQSERMVLEVSSPTQPFIEPFEPVELIPITFSGSPTPL
jgi:hypothetical protein